MALYILEAAEHHSARLHAFTVMSHHIHYLLTPNENQTISQFTQSFKSHTSKEMTPLLNQFERSQLKEQIGLNRRSFWKVSFRGLPVYSEEVFRQKVNYIHQNAVRSGYVEEAEDYAWSSGHLYLAELFDEFTGLKLQESIALFRAIEV
jgi:putative transposase